MTDPAPIQKVPNPEAIRTRRLREDAERPMSQNLSEAIQLSHTLIRIAGTARLQ